MFFGACYFGTTWFGNGFDELVVRRVVSGGVRIARWSLIA
jgi:hypothetical protein